MTVQRPMQAHVAALRIDDVTTDDGKFVAKVWVRFRFDTGEALDVEGALKLNGDRLFLEAQKELRLLLIDALRLRRDRKLVETAIKQAVGKPLF